MNFCLQYTSCYRPERAAREAGWPAVRAPFVAKSLMDDPRIIRQIRIIEAERLRAFKFKGDEFFARIVRLATANAAEELFETWIPPCRYCWGINNEYQRTYAEFEEAFEEWNRLPDARGRRSVPMADFGYGPVLVYGGEGEKLPFDEKGGSGYDLAKPPNPICPNCQGRGLESETGPVMYIRPKPLAELSDVGRSLVSGYEQTTRGLKVLARSQDAAQDQILRMLTRWLEFRAEQGQAMPNTGNPLDFGIGLTQEVAGLITDDPRSLSDQELDSLLAGYGVVIDEDGNESGGGG